MKTLLGVLWRKLPARARRLGVWLAESRFTVTVSAVVQDDRGRVLLLKHRFRKGSGWGIPGGFINPGEQPEDALRRELREEINLELADARLSFVRTLRRPRQLEIIYVCAASEPRRAVEEHNIEIVSLAWHSPEELPASLARDQHHIIRRALGKSRD